MGQRVESGGVGGDCSDLPETCDDDDEDITVWRKAWFDSVEELSKVVDNLVRRIITEKQRHSD